VLSSLMGCPPVCVLCLLVDAVVSLLDPNTSSFTGGGQLGTGFGLEGFKNMEGIVQIFTPSPSRILGDEAQVDTGKGKLNNGTSYGTVARRESSIRLLDDQSTSVDLVLKPHRVLVTRSLPFTGRSDLPFLGSLPGGSHSVSLQDMYLNHAAAKSGVSLPTILEGTPLESSALNMKLDPRYFFGLDSIEHE
jgi:hypothetical protein